MGIVTGFTPTITLHFGSLAFAGYIGLFALTFNLIAVVVMTYVFDGFGVSRGQDATRPEDYVGI
jgi:hypothetical protein